MTAARLIALSTAATLSLMASMAHAEPNPPAGNVPPGEILSIPVPEGSPLQFEVTSHDFGKIPDTTPVAYDFKFKNTSNRTVKLLSVKATCGCTTTKADSEIAPGAESKITATFNPHGRSGREIKTITVELDDPKVKTISLTAAAYVQKKVMVEPMALFLGEVPIGQGAVQEVSISGRDPNFEVTSFKAENPLFTIAPLGKDTVEVEGDKVVRYRYSFTLNKNAPAGQINFAANFNTNDPQMATIQVNALGVVVGKLRSLPERIPVRYIGEGEPFVADITVEHREGTPFKILSAEVDPSANPLRIVLDVQTIKTSNRNQYRIRVGGTCPQNFADVTGSIKIRTDVPEMAEMTIPLFGVQMAPTPSVNTSQSGTLPPAEIKVNPAPTTAKPH